MLHERDVVDLLVIGLMHGYRFRFLVECFCVLVSKIVVFCSVDLFDIIGFFLGVLLFGDGAAVIVCGVRKANWLGLEVECAVLIVVVYLNFECCLALASVCKILRGIP